MFVFPFLFNARDPTLQTSKDRKLKVLQKEQVRIHEISHSPACLCLPSKSITDQRTNGPTDQWTNGQTHPIIESWLTTKRFSYNFCRSFSFSFMAVNI